MLTDITALCPFFISKNSDTITVPCAGFCLVNPHRLHSDEAKDITLNTDDWGPLGVELKWRPASNNKTSLSAVRTRTYWLPMMLSDALSVHSGQLDVTMTP
ncbi:hypothetical protein CHS0354_006479 [Potamilus streckersoni]|uniref:Uncharacterized protein n=1 Tax=Potamilus streckersoni TaxID=2493646 RepID=A0AAE0T9A8_9BIVA|nr:hypothetical protein CHS0354_006479 [Potamilus streckersoni]